MGGIGSLSATRFEETSSLQLIEHGFEQQIWDIALDKSRSKLAEDRKIEALVFQLQVKGILPIDACAHGVSSLTIGKSFGELHEGDQGQLPGSKRGLSVFGKQISKHLILEKHPKFISHLILSELRTQREIFPESGECPSQNERSVGKLPAQRGLLEGKWGMLSSIF